MSRKSLITDRERTIIAMVYNNNRESTAEVIQQEASKKCGRDLGLSTVQRVLAKLRKDKTRGSTDPQDNQWSLASIGDYPISANSLPLLLYIQSTFSANIPDIAHKYAKRNRIDDPFLTNRLAKWIDRLHIIADIDPNKSKKLKPLLETTDKSNIWPEWIDNLIHVAMYYSNYEIGCELSHVNPINTALFDSISIDKIMDNIESYQNNSLFFKSLKGLNDDQLVDKFDDINASILINKGGKNK